MKRAYITESLDWEVVGPSIEQDRKFATQAEAKQWLADHLQIAKILGYYEKQYAIVHTCDVN